MTSHRTGFNCVLALGMATMFLVAAKTADDFRTDWFKPARADERIAAYITAHSEPYCAFKGVWHDWDDDQTITLGCLEVNDNVRSGSYISWSGPRASSHFWMSGSYSIDSDGVMRVLGKDSQGKPIKFGSMIEVDNKEYPTQMIIIDKRGEESIYIWKRDGTD